MEPEEIGVSEIFLDGSTDCGHMNDNGYYCYAHGGVSPVFLMEKISPQGRRQLPYGAFSMPFAYGLKTK
jgi:hypothetical protein